MMIGGNNNEGRNKGGAGRERRSEGGHTKDDRLANPVEQIFSETE
jgi:hypothetical protein